MPMPREDTRSLRLLWHDGRVAVTTRRSFRRVYDLAERVYPATDPASTAAYEDSWLLTGLSGNGVATERHLTGYITGPSPSAADRKRVLTRNLRAGRIVEVEVPGLRGPFYSLPEQVEALGTLPDPVGTTLLCPFDSLLWQRQRAEDLLGFRYRIEIYTPPAKREFGYYTLPILHDGSLVGRLDPKLHRDRDQLEGPSAGTRDWCEALQASHRRSRRGASEPGRIRGCDSNYPPSGLAWARLIGRHVRSQDGSLKATSAGASPPTVRAMYCRPSSM